MANINRQIAQELGVREEQIAATVELLDGGATVPFVARYRKEITGGLDDAQLRTLEERLTYLRELEERRTAILATFSFIKHGQFEDSLKIAKVLMTDKEDLIHKAVGWMLREVGNRDRAAADRFLERHCRRMPRTMLRYAIEKLDDDERKRWMASKAAK